MSTESVRHTTWRRRAVIGVPLLLGVGILLVACGGGGSASPSSTTEATSSEAALATAATSAASVPSGWQGRPPKSEVINGITVPPEPAPSINNATLAGVDSNKNGVRDDVERLLAETSRKETFEPYALTIAKLYNKLATQEITSPAEVSQIVDAIHCLNIKRPVDEQIMPSTNDIWGATTNTPSRIARYKKNTAESSNVIKGEPTCP